MGPPGGPGPVGAPSLPGVQEGGSLPVDMTLSPGGFIENTGQMGEGAGLFYSMGDTLSVAFHRDGVGLMMAPDRSTDGPDGVVVRMDFKGSDPVTPRGRLPMGHLANFMVGSDRSDWHLGVQSYSEIVYHGLWDGVDARFYEKGDTLKYDIVLAPHADVDSVRLSFQGMSRLRLDPSTGDLLIDTQVGTMRDEAPVAFQGGEAVECSFSMDGDGDLGFRLGRYDPDRPLVIDPGLSFSTYLGSKGYDAPGYDPSPGVNHGGMAIDGDGYIYVTGGTTGADFPNTTGAYQTQHEADWDCYVTKMAPNGTSLVYSTFITGADAEQAYGIVVDGSKCAYVVGRTNSSDFPTTTDAPDRVYSGGTDVFLLKLNATGSQLLFSTLFGGSKDDNAIDMALDADGNVHFTGGTYSNDLPTTSGAIDTSYGGFEDVFVGKLNMTSKGLDYVTYLGGTYYDLVYDMEVDPLGRAVLCGVAQSSEFPTTKGTYQEDLGNASCGFVTKLNASGSAVDVSTFFRYATFSSLEVRTNGSVLLTGYGSVANMPTSSGAYDARHNGNHDVVVVQMDAGLSSLEFSTYLGTNSDEFPFHVVTGTDGEVAVAGYTYSNAFPTTQDAYDGTFNGRYDVFISVLDWNCSDLEYSTYMGGQQYETVEDLSWTSDGFLMAMGGTSSNDFPTTSGVYGGTFKGAEDAFIVQLDMEPPDISDIQAPAQLSCGDTLTVTARISDNEEVTRVEFDHGWSSGNLTSTHFPLRTSGDEKDGTWKAEIDISAHRMGTLFFRFNADDRAGHEAQSGELNVTIIDDRAPRISLVDTPPATTGDLLGATVDVSDNIQVEDVTFVYWYGDDPGKARNCTCSEEATVPSGNGTWRTDYRVPTYNLRPVNYYFVVFDRQGCSARTPTVRVDVTDDDHVQYLWHHTPNEVDLGEPITFEVVVNDNVGVLGIRVHWRYGKDGELLDGDMVPTNVTGVGNGTYEYTISTPKNDSMLIPYFYVAFDTSANWVHSETMNVTVRDQEPPVFVADATDRLAFTGLPLNFTVHVADNVAIKRVDVDYDLGGANVRRKPMVRLDTDARGNGLWRYTIDLININPQFPVRYFFIVEDRDGNVVESPRFNVSVRDLVPPTIRTTLVVDPPTTGDLLVIRLDARDNMAITKVSGEWAHASGRTGVMPFGELDTDQAGIGWWQGELWVPDDIVGNLTINITVEDPHENTVSTEVEVVVTDNDRPVILEDLTERSALKGTTHTIVVRARDNVGIVNTSLLLQAEWFEGSVVYMSTSGNDTYSYQLAVPRNASGSLSYRVNLGDATGQRNVLYGDFVDLYNAPPELVFEGAWAVMEEELCTLDLAPYIDDRNDPMNDLTMTCSDPLVTVVGFTLMIYLDEWEIDFSLMVTVSDGEDSSTLGIPVRVTNVNDPPEFLQVQPFLIHIANVSEPVFFQVKVTDPDIGDFLTVKWTSNISGVLMARNENQNMHWVTSDLEPGWHGINITLSDGHVEVVARVDVIIVDPDAIIPTDGPDDLPGLTYEFSTRMILILAVFIAIPIVVAVVGFYLIDRARGHKW